MAETILFWEIFKTTGCLRILGLEQTGFQVLA